MSNELSKLRKIVSETMNIGHFDRRESPCPVRQKYFVSHSFWYVFHFFVWPRCFSANAGKINAAIEWMERQKQWYEGRGFQFPPKPLYYN